ncbi:MAG: hypothetical protein D6800_02260, partial [Candidatus Zixiibacteriota bacterium]
MNRKIRYEQITGPGTIDPRTGVWVYYVDSTVYDTDFVWVRIVASLNHDHEYESDTCSFAVHYRDYPLKFLTYCGAEYEVMPSEQIQIPLEAFDADSCDHPDITGIFIDSFTADGFSFDSVSNVLTFAPSEADSGKEIPVTVEATSGALHTLCHLLFRVGHKTPAYVRIQNAQLDPVSGIVSVPVTATRNEREYNGFRLQIAYPYQALDFLGADPGDVFDPSRGCAWSFFRVFEGPCGTGCSERLINVQGDGYYDRFAQEQYPDSCLPPDTSAATLFTLLFAPVSPVDTAIAGPLRFYWNHCTDNVLTYNTRDTLRFLMPLEVRTLGDSPLPSSCPPSDSWCDSCYIYNTRTRARAVVYQNGGKGAVCRRGDINGNTTPYDIGDAVMLTYYFM